MSDFPHVSPGDRMTYLRRYRRNTFTTEAWSAQFERETR